MSYNESLQNAIQNILENYWLTLSKKYNLNVEELRSLWSNETSFVPSSALRNESKTNNISSVDMEDISEARLVKANVAELKALCKHKGLKVSGKKQELVDRLLNREGNLENSSFAPSNSEKKVTKSNRATDSASVIKKLTSIAPVIPITRNSFGNMEHPETSLVFNRLTSEVIGKQLDNGDIADLTEEDIENCKRFKFRYKLPSNLDKNSKLNNVKVAELDDDMVIEDDSNEESEVVEDEDDDVVEEEDEVVDDD